MASEIEYQVQLSDEELEELKKQPKVYRNEKMLYRLNKIDVYKAQSRLGKNKAQYDLMYSAIKQYLNERNNSQIQTALVSEFFSKNPETGKQEFKDDFYSEVLRVAVSHFYGVPYNKLAYIKNLNMESKTENNLYSMISYEELSYINQIKKSIVESGKKVYYKSEKDAFVYAVKLGNVAREKFMSEYGVDPALIEKGELSSLRVEKFQYELANIINDMERQPEQADNEDL